jgi:hypothetical protein
MDRPFEDWYEPTDFPEFYGPPAEPEAEEAEPDDGGDG